MKSLPWDQAVVCDRRAAEAGFSAVEALLMITLVGMATLSMVHSIVSSSSALKTVEQEAMIIDQAQVLMTRLAAIPFGTGSEGSASTFQLAQIVGVENSLFGSPYGSTATTNGGGPVQTFLGAEISLKQIEAASPLTWQYEVGNKTYYAHDGSWEIIVDRDLNGDGDLTDPDELASQANQDLLRIEIRFNDRRIVRTIRSRNPTE